MGQHTIAPSKSHSVLYVHNTTTRVVQSYWQAVFQQSHTTLFPSQFLTQQENNHSPRNLMVWQWETLALLKQDLICAAQITTLLISGWSGAIFTTTTVDRHIDVCTRCAIVVRYSHVTKKVDVRVGRGVRLGGLSCEIRNEQNILITQLLDGMFLVNITTTPSNITITQPIIFHQNWKQHLFLCDSPAAGSLLPSPAGE